MLFFCWSVFGPKLGGFRPTGPLLKPGVANVFGQELLQRPDGVVFGGHQLRHSGFVQGVQFGARGGGKDLKFFSFKKCWMVERFLICKKVDVFYCCWFLLILLVDLILCFWTWCFKKWLVFVFEMFSQQFTKAAGCSWQKAVDWLVGWLIFVNQWLMFVSMVDFWL